MIERMKYEELTENMRAPLYAYSKWHVEVFLAAGWLPPEAWKFNVREGERAAWDRGACSGTSYTFPDGLMPAQRLDSAYPPLPSPLAKPESAPLKLSTGTYVHGANGPWRHEGSGVNVASPFCQTAADHRAMASWLDTHGEGR